VKKRVFVNEINTLRGFSHITGGVVVVGSNPAAPTNLFESSWMGLFYCLELLPGLSCCFKKVISLICHYYSLDLP
jgi:hypothetical protein